MTTTKTWWLEEPLCIIEICDCYHIAQEGAKAFDPAGISRRMCELQAVGCHVFPVGGHLNGKDLWFRHKSPGDPPMALDYLEGWLRHAKPLGLRTVVYFNVHSVKAEYAKLHPNWQQRRYDGTPKDDVYNVDSAFCLNSPWRDWVFDRLRELLAYPIDGIFYDGPVVFQECCFCEHCKALYQARDGGAMPPKTDRDHPEFPKLVEFQSDSMARFLADSQRLIKSIRPEVLFYMNSNGLGPDYATGRNNRKLVPHQDILACEGGFLYGDLNTVPWWKVAMNAKLIEAEAATAGKPTLIFGCIAHKSWTYFSLPATEVKLIFASSVAHGAGTWLAIMKDSMREPAVQVVEELYHFARAHRQDLFDTHSLSEVAILASKATMNYYSGADVPLTDFTRSTSAQRAGNYNDEFQGFYRALVSRQVHFDLIDDQTLLEPNLSRFKLIILPNVACLPGEAAKALARYVRDGGTILATFETGFYDGYGRRCDRPQLADLLGIVYGAEPLEGPRGIDYLFRHDSAPYDQDITATYIPSPLYAMTVQAAAAARVPLTFSTKSATQYGSLPQDSNRPAMVVHRVGKGQAIYFAGDLGGALHMWHLAEHIQFVRNLVAGCDASPLSIDPAPESLEVSLRRTRDGRKVLLHLVNYTGGMTRPITRVVPLKGLSVSLRLPGPARSVRTLWSPSELPFRSHGNTVEFSVDVEECQIVEIELK